METVEQVLVVRLLRLRGNSGSGLTRKQLGEWEAETGT